MAKLYNNNNDDYTKLEKGIKCNDLFIYSKNNYLYIIKDDIRLFNVSYKRLKKTFYPALTDIFSIIVKNPNNIYLQINKSNPNQFILVIYHHNNQYNLLFKYEIKLKEIDDYLRIFDNENTNTIIHKQNEKINILINKIKYYKTKYYEPSTDDEFL
jgi:hypothetical protein